MCRLNSLTLFKFTERFELCFNFAHLRHSTGSWSRLKPAYQNNPVCFSAARYRNVHELLMKLLKLCDKHIFFPLLWKHLDIKEQQERLSPHQRVLKRRWKGSERTSRNSGVTSQVTGSGAQRDPAHTQTPVRGSAMVK